MSKKNFFKKIETFCEGHIHEKEYINTISALFISYLGYYGINKNNDNIINLLFSLLFSNGIFSALNHYYNVEGYSYLDGLTMILPITIGNLHIYQLFLKKLSSWDNIYKLFYLIFPSLTYLSITIQAFTKHFDYLFLSLSLLLIGFVPLINNYSNEYHIVLIKENFIKGCLFIIIAAGLWFYSEPKCVSKNVSKKQKKKIAKLHLHGIWHILSGYGFYILIHCMNLITLYDKGEINDLTIINSFNNILPKI